MNVSRMGAAMLLFALLAAGRASAELCEECRKKAFTADVGECAICGGATSSGAFSLCRECSAKRRQCEACGKRLKTPAGRDTTEGEGRPERRDKADLSRPGEYSSGEWTYRLVVKRPGTRSEGRFGTLSYKEKDVTAAGINDYIETPWGRLYWVGSLDDDSWGDHGWMPRPNPSPLHKPEGKRITPDAAAKEGAPKGAEPEVVETKVLTTADDGKTLLIMEGTIIEIKLEGNPSAGYEWKRISAAPQALEPVGKGGWVLETRGGVAEVGRSGFCVFRFKAAKAGEDRLAFEYRRPGDRILSGTFSVTVKVEGKPSAGAGEKR